ncbi:hypothetical protein CM19_05280 [Candidatus Acidianus copahuensis]|uniref:Uncharacterized protein n=1 Tax=Candidatus Acidianus copahuensis TaxID=1160895 RepID=A0A031LQU7_9CREN|nr:hypothetical protein CM19_05280 [Candidatus Acidianus copahuensis]NON61798.1 hypothetical protein [Acidianus sp. RZ1]
MLMRWLKKREVVIYFLLYRKFGYSQFNLGEALYELSPFFSKKVSLSVIKYLVKLGLLIRNNNYYFTLVPFEEYILLNSYDYLKRRSSLRRKIQ